MADYIMKIATLAPWRVLGIDECGGATSRRSQAHATKEQTGNDRKTKEKARRRGAVPAESLGDRLRVSRRAILFYLVFFPVPCSSERKEPGKKFPCSAQLPGERYQNTIFI